MKKFTLTDKQYNALKWIGLILIPLGTLVVSVADAWHDPGVVDSVGATLSAIGVFIGSLVALSNKNYKGGDDNE